MADILYTYKNQLYANITNQCNCSCCFCIRTHARTVGNAQELWHQKDPDSAEIKAALDHFDLTGYTELVYCGYGEPTCALDTLIHTASYAKNTYGLKIRLNTNGLGNLQHKTDIVPRLASVIDTISISLNAPDAQTYQKITRPGLPDAYPALLDFAEKCKKQIPHVIFTIVDILTAQQQQACQEVADAMHIPLRIRHYT